MIKEVTLINEQMNQSINLVRYTSTTQSMLGIHLPKVTLVGNLI